MIRLTLLGLKRVSPEVVEAGAMSGCSNSQMMLKVLIPTARRDILIGTNQVIMQCLAMAVIASFIGAKGLGFNLLLALNQLRIGQALELGICLSLLRLFWINCRWLGLTNKLITLLILTFPNDTNMQSCFLFC